jgi:hypothetical protein
MTGWSAEQDVPEHFSSYSGPEYCTSCSDLRLLEFSISLEQYGDNHEIIDWMLESFITSRSEKVDLTTTHPRRCALRTEPI